MKVRLHYEFDGDYLDKDQALEAALARLQDDLENGAAAFEKIEVIRSYKKRQKPEGDRLCQEAADEIERLRGQLEQVRTELSAALGWPGGISAELRPLPDLIDLVARWRVA